MGDANVQGQKNSVCSIGVYALNKTEIDNLRLMLEDDVTNSKNIVLL